MAKKRIYAEGDVVTTVGTPGSDSNIPTEQAVREAIAAGGGTSGSYTPTLLDFTGTVVLAWGSYQAIGKSILVGGHISLGGTISWTGSTANPINLSLPSLGIVGGNTHVATGSIVKVNGATADFGNIWISQSSNGLTTRSMQMSSVVANDVIEFSVVIMVQ